MKFKSLNLSLETLQKSNSFIFPLVTKVFPIWNNKRWFVTLLMEVFV